MPCSDLIRIPSILVNSPFGKEETVCCQGHPRRALDDQEKTADVDQGLEHDAMGNDNFGT